MLEVVEVRHEASVLLIDFKVRNLFLIIKLYAPHIKPKMCRKKSVVYVSLSFVVTNLVEMEATIGNKEVDDVSV